MNKRDEIVQQAAFWLVRWDNGYLSQEEQHAFDQWHHSSAEHERIWSLAGELNRQFAGVPSQLARPVLTRPRPSRRALLKSFVGVGLLLPAGMMAAKYQPWQPLLAQHRTSVGERRTVKLADGSKLILNTDTALDVHFDARQRLINVYQGEVLVRTANDPQRPFAIRSAAGTVINENSSEPAVFALRCLDQASLLTVRRQSVRVIPAALESGYNTENLLVNSRQQCRFTADGVEWVADAPAGSLAWRRGELVVNRWPMAQVVAELSRYRPGIMRCDPAVAELKVSGVFQTAKTDQALEALAALFGLQITRITPYWVSLGAAV